MLPFDVHQTAALLEQPQRSSIQRGSFPLWQAAQAGTEFVVEFSDCKLVHIVLPVTSHSLDGPDALRVVAELDVGLGNAAKEKGLSMVKSMIGWGFADSVCITTSAGAAVSVHQTI